MPIVRKRERERGEMVNKVANQYARDQNQQYTRSTRRKDMTTKKDIPLKKEKKKKKKGYYIIMRKERTIACNGVSIDGNKHVMSSKNAISRCAQVDSIDKDAC